MLEAFVGGLFIVFSWPTFGLMLIGVAAGFAVGILPGLGGTVTLAIMLPFTFDMTPTEAFAFLLGMGSVTSTTGDITSILFGVPGESTSAATIVDGHAMAKNGEAGRALGAALMSSLVGAVLGAFALALAIPIVRPVVLAFGSPELFMLSIVGLTFVGTLSSKTPLKGLIAGGLGMLVAMVGMDPQSGIQRYTFGFLHLWDGVGLIPVTLGLFAVPEIYDLAVKGTSIAKGNPGKLGGVWQGVKDTFTHFGITVRCSLVGAFIGIIPGLGAGVSQWMAYAHAVQSSPDKDRFGKGAVEGVLGPGAANNSGLGGSLIPTVAFGVPGSVFTAVLMGGFLIQGLVPGPAMLTTNLTLTMSFVWIIVVSNIITVSVCLLFLNQISKITFIRGPLLIPFITLLILIGAFAEKNAMMDILLMLTFGLLGLVMVHFDWPRPPIVLGLVLGDLAETYLFLSTDRYGWYWLLDPLVLGLLLLAVVVVFYPSFRSRRQA